MNQGGSSRQQLRELLAADLPPPDDYAWWSAPLPRGGARLDVHELRVRGVRDQATVAAIRWELFVFAEVRDVVSTLRPETVAVLYEGGRPDPEAWCAVLRDAGYEAAPARGEG